jgi:hypothetical protein
VGKKKDGGRKKTERPTERKTIQIRQLVSEEETTKSERGKREREILIRGMQPQQQPCVFMLVHVCEKKKRETPQDHFSKFVKDLSKKY